MRHNPPSALRLSLAPAFLLCPHPALADPTRDSVIYSTLSFADDVTYDTGNGNAYSGQGSFGCIYDLQACDDFVIPDGVTRLTSITTDSISFFGRNPAGGSQVELWTAAGGAPGELLVSLVAPTTTTYFFEPVFGLIGTRITADGLDIPVSPGASYFIVSQPRDLTRDGDWYYIIRDLDSRIGADGYFREPGRGCGQVFWPDWTAFERVGHGRGDVGMEIRGVPAPATHIALGIAGAISARRRRTGVGRILAPEPEHARQETIIRILADSRARSAHVRLRQGAGSWIMPA